MVFVEKLIRIGCVSLVTVTLISCGLDEEKKTMTRKSISGSQPAPDDMDKGSSAGTEDVSGEDPSPESSSQLPDDTTDETPASQIRSSKGSGGATGLQEISFTSGNNLASSYRINAPADAGNGKIYGLHIHLHGDGGGGYRDFPNRETRFDLIGVTVKAPNTGLQWGRSQGVAHAQFLNDLIQNELIKKYNIDLDRIYFSGVSGGAYFLTGNFLPSFGQVYNSGALMLCGGEAPRVPFVQADMLKTFRLHWQVTAGERADILPSIDASQRAYRDALDELLLNSPDNMVDPDRIQTAEKEGAGGHCEFDGLNYTQGIQSMMDRRFEIILKR